LKINNLKNLFLIPILLLVVFSCSPDEETQAPTNTVQTTTPEPVVTQYTLTVTASEGGSVSAGGTFDDGTSVSVTATPAEGYEFVGWEGSTATEENLTITLNSNQDYQALFELIPQSLKNRLIEIGYNIPKENPKQELITASSVPQELINDFFEVQSSLNSTIGGYDNYLMVIWDTNENSQNVIDKLKDLRFNESEGWTTVEELGLNCLTGNLWYGPGEPDEHDICINSYEWFLNPQFNNRPQQNQKSLDTYHMYAHEYFHAYQRRQLLDYNLSDAAPTWWVEGCALYFQNIWMLENHKKFSKLSGLVNERELTNNGRSQAENYKSYKRIFQGIEEGWGSINENWYLTSLEESYQTRDNNTQTFVEIVVAYLAYITSPEIAMIKILEDGYDLGFEGSFVKHTGLTYQEFYEDFNNFMRSENPNSDPPLGMFIKGDINEYADFWNIKVKTQ
jgi:hypothetical protein